jgi:hypothetical protein
VFDRAPLEREGEKLALGVGAGLGRIESDYTGPSAHPVGAISLDYPVFGGVSVGVRGEGGLIDVNDEAVTFGAASAVLRTRLLPSAPTTPTVSLGIGALFAPDVPNVDGPFLYGSALAGLETRLASRVGLFLEGGIDYPFQEGLDGLQGSGGINDNVWVGRAGLVYYTSF